MAVIKPVPGPPSPDIVVREDYVGSCTHAICYPGVSSCVTVTGVGAGLMVGAHLTMGTSAAELDAFFVLLQAQGAAACQEFFVAGAFGQFKAHVPAPDFKTRKKMRNRIVAETTPAANVRFYDTTALGDIHIFAVINGAAADFSYAVSAGNFIAGFAYPAFATTPIPLGGFVLR